MAGTESERRRADLAAAYSDSARAALEEALARTPGDLRLEPRWDPLRDHPRYIALATGGD